VGKRRPGHDEECLAEEQFVGAGLDADQVVAEDAGYVVGLVTAPAVVQQRRAAP